MSTILILNLNANQILTLHAKMEITFNGNFNSSQFHIKDLLMFLGANIFTINQGDRYVKFQSQDITINKTSIRQNQTLLSLQQQRIVQNLILKDNCT